MGSRKPKARYIVGIPHGPILYEGNLRIAAWWYWLFNRRQAVAFDRIREEFTDFLKTVEALRNEYGEVRIVFDS